MPSGTLTAQMTSADGASINTARSGAKSTVRKLKRAVHLQAANYWPGRQASLAVARAAPRSPRSGINSRFSNRLAMAPTAQLVASSFLTAADDQRDDGRAESDFEELPPANNSSAARQRRNRP